MGNVDQADQLRLQYCIHYWIRNNKWWWAIFFWIFECSLTNCYVLYKKFYELHHQKPLSHYDFIKSIALAWIDPKTYWPSTWHSRKRNQVMKLASQASRISSDNSTASDGVSTRRQLNMDSRNIRFTEQTLNPYDGLLRCRLDNKLSHLPEKSTKIDPQCQLHYYFYKKKMKAQILKCSSCNVTLCVGCYKLFHEVPSIAGVVLD